MKKRKFTFGGRKVAYEMVNRSCFPGGVEAYDRLRAATIRENKLMNPGGEPIKWDAGFYLRKPSKPKKKGAKYERANG